MKMYLITVRRARAIVEEAVIEVEAPGLADACAQARCCVNRPDLQWRTVNIAPDVEVHRIEENT